MSRGTIANILLAVFLFSPPLAAGLYALSIPFWGVFAAISVSALVAAILLGLG